MKWGLKGGISIDVDSGPPRYVLWYCGGICYQPDTFIQISSGHTVLADFDKIIKIGTWKFRGLQVKNPS